MAAAKRAARSAKRPEEQALGLLERLEMTESVVNDLRSLGDKAHAIVVAVAQGTYAKASDRQRSHAIYVLGRAQRDGVDRVLARIAAQSSDERLRGLAILALGNIGTRAACRALARALTRPRASIAETAFAVQLLGQVGGTQDDEKALELFRDRTRMPQLVERAESAIAAVRRRRTSA